MISKLQISLSGKELSIGLLIFLVSVLVLAGSRWSRLHNSQAISSDHTIHIYLDTPADLDELTHLLADSNLIYDRNEFRWAARIFGWNNFREGHYQVDRGFDYDAFLSKLAKGLQDPVSVTILPGRSKSEIVEMVSNDLQFDSLAFHQTITDSAFLAEVEIEQKDVIGRLFPNTYSIYWTTSPQSFFERILEEFENSVLDPYKQRIDELDLTVNEIVTLASIVEWEAHNEKEKAIISGLYWNRLENGMRLQADPTINYALGERRRLLYEDYRIDHPYNTYLHRGLPPGPITNPSLSSIEAVLHPQEHEYLYMVASPDGSHSFSETFKEHKQKSAEWRKWLREQYRIKRQREQNSN